MFEGLERRIVLLRRWAGVALAVLLVFVSAGSLLPRLAQATPDGVPVAVGDGAVVQSGPALISHRVVPGDTLWDLAVRVSAGDDPRTAVERIRQLNNLGSTGLQVGDEVLLPAGG
jgi:hypothetical protein